ncbi:retrotransposon protein, putative, ty1-copia subclass [Tanacetum coccineum]|uniref:Retrotransposon protein, putative, ty1-copia subclass n=1 Tax=Tanacetum coccineum TaxID=301880 RepID=A0ABQ5F8R8_9ASTR
MIEPEPVNKLSKKDQLKLDEEVAQRTELVKGSSEKAEVDEDKETSELKILMEFIPDEEEVVVDAIPLATKPLSIVYWKIHKKRKEKLLPDNQGRWKFKDVLMEDLDLVLYGDLKTMFEPHVEDQVWKNQSDYRVLEWKLYDSYYGILVSKNNVLYFNAISHDGIYEIDMLTLVPNVNSIYNVCNKRAKHNLDSTYLWNCRLAHISKTHIKKLQHDRLRKSTYDESFDQCVSFLSGKMTRKPSPHHTKSAIDLLRLIHTDVCGLLRHVSRQGAGYFITFTDDYSRYGYVYLLKHKHEVFERIRVFKNEVENQLGKITKALRSDRGGEYISQVFKDYLKACGIVQHLTPPYTPQHNGMPERRNRTLLDMVRSMMHLTTLPLSFWDYALDFATHILNMVWGCEALVKRDTPDKLQQNLLSKPVEEQKNMKKNLISSENTSKIPMKVEGFKPPQKEEAHVCRSVRTHQAPECLCLNVEVDEHSLGDLNKPTNYKAAISYSKSDKWLDAMNAEMVDYEETFSPVADIRAIRILIALAAFYEYEIWKMDVKTAFLNGCLDEDIYMMQPEGFVDPKYPKKVCKLQRCIYGLKQASRSWNKRFDEEIKRCTRPDVAFAQNVTSCFQQNPEEPHWTAVKTILKYLRNTKDMFLVYGGNPEAELRVNCYCDAGFETNRDDIKSQTRYVFILNEGIVD